MGTAGYMSPEQVRGKVVDKRSDIFSFACVLYEMLAGVQAFRGDTVADSIGATLHKEHDQSLLPANTPANVKRLLHRCLAKNRQERLRDIGDARIELVATEPSDNSSSPSVSKMHLAMAAAAVLVAVALTFGIAYLVFPRQNPLNLHAAINLPAGFRLDNVNSSLALSSDGTILAFTATGTDGLQRLWIRSMNGLESQALTGTDDASYPFWSPDGQSLGFFSRHKLKTIELGTGTVRALCDAPNGRGGSWGGRGIIVFAPDYQTGLFTIPASGGTPVQVTTLKEENETHRHPFFLADGRHVLFVRALPSVNKSDGIYWLDLDNGRTAKVVDSSSQALYANGYLIFERGTALMAQPFDMKALQATGQAVIVAEDVQSNSGRYLGEFSLSQAGMLVYVTGSQYSVSRLTIYGEDGNKLSDIGQPAIFSELIQISPDGRKIAAAVARPDGIFDIWIFDVNGGNGRRLTFAADGRTAPVWSRDNSRLLFQDLKGQLYEQPQDGSTPERKLKIQFKNRNDFITSLSADGEFLSVVSQTKGGLDVVIMPLKGGEPKPYATTPAWETEPTFSPDGKWLAYVSDETGRYEVFVVPVPGGQGKFQVSSNGGQSPVWINGGHELAYVNDQRKLVAVELRSSGMQMETGRTRMLFGGQTLPVFPGVEAGSAGGSPVYISPDGKRVVIAVPTNLSSETPLNLITNWTGNLGLK
jgi:Tol biopolymer transport system component